MDLEGLSLVCAGLGSVEEDDQGVKIGYTKSEHCLENLKDLLRFLRRDDPETRHVFKQVCKWNIVAKDLIPIIEHYQEDHNLVLNAVKVLVYLTIPIDTKSIDIPQQIEYLWGLKSSITSSHTVAVAVSLLEVPLHNLESEAFTEEDWKLVQLVLTLFQNLLAVQDITLQQKLGGSACQIISLRDRFLKLLFDENVMDLIIVLAQHVEDSHGFLRKDNLLIMETFHFIFMGQDPQMVAKAHTMGSQEEPAANNTLDSLKLIMHDEKRQNISRLRTLGRHSQFVGTFTRLTMDGSKSLSSGNPVLAPHDNQFKSNKGKHGPAKKTAWDHGILPSTEIGILRSLHDFVNQFLKGGYNALMESVRKDIEKEHHAIENSDVVVFFRVTQFITSFQYYKYLNSKPEEQNELCDGYTENDNHSPLFSGNICGPIASSLNESMFLLVISKWRQAFEGLKETKDFKFVSAAGSVMKTLIGMLDMVFKLSPDKSKESRTARILLYKLFYDQTDQGMTQFVLCLMKSFDIHKQPKSDLSDLVEMIHVILRVLEKLQADGTLRVSKKTRKRGKKKTQNVGSDDKSHAEPAVDNEVDILNDGQTVETNVAREDKSAEDKGKGDQCISKALVSDKMDVESNLPRTDNQESDHSDLQKSDQANNNDHFSELSDSSDEEQPVATTEVDFKVSTLVSAFANEHIVRNLCWLLSFYRNNSVKTNYYIVCMLRRICEDLELFPMLYQISFLTIFNNILAEQKSCPCKDYENIVQFLTDLVRRMLRKMKRQPLLFVEILFWKTRRECKYISCESMLHELTHLRDETSNWRSASRSGGFSPRGPRRSIADALGDDEADFDMTRENDTVEQAFEDADARSNLNTESGSKENLESVKGELSKRNKRLVLNGKMEDRLKNLYDELKDDPQCTQLIANALDSYGNISQKQVSYKLKQLGHDVPSKRRLRKAARDSTTDQPMEGVTSESDPNSNDAGKNPTLGKELPSKKRVRAFSKDQEEMIRRLYEQYKDQRRCSYLIANALDDNGSVKAAQVSRKLKQLGLHAPKLNMSEKLGLGVESLEDSGTDNEQNSFSETLKSIKNRTNKKFKWTVNEDNSRDNVTEPSDDSFDDEPIGRKFQEKKKLKKTVDKDHRMENVAEEPSDYSFDDEPVGMKSQIIQSQQFQETSEQPMTTSSHQSMPESNKEDYHNPDMAGSGLVSKITDIEGDLVDAPTSLKTLPTNSGSQGASKNRTSEQNEELLEDSEDDVAPVGLPQNDATRRRKLMVIDLEDD